VADYAASLLRALRREGEVRLGEGDVNLYQVGNNGLHGAIYRRALERSGVTLLHDAVLHHYLLSALGERAYEDEFVYNYGEWARSTAKRLWRDRARSAGAAEYFEYPMVRRIAERSRLVVVHTERARRIVKRHAPDARVEVVPHLWEPAEVVQREVEDFRERLPRGTIFGVFGHLRETKRLTTVLRAFERVKGASLLVSGDFVSDEYRRAVGEKLRGPRVCWLRYAGAREFDTRAAAVDVAINLKWPSAGEASGIGVRLAGAGKPVIATEGGSIDIDPGPGETEHLAAAMQWTIESRADREELGRIQARRTRENHAVGKVAAQLWKLAAAAAAALALAGAAEKREARVRMRDGVRLATNVFLPAAEGRWPAILLRTPYGKGVDLPSAYAPFVDRGYALVVQDVRGRGASEGEFRPLDQEAFDGEDTIAWAARQPWCTARIAMLGGSYSGLAQWKAAQQRPAGLDAIFPVHGGIDEYADRFYSSGGALRLGHRMLWLFENLRAPGARTVSFDNFVRHLPLRTMDTHALGRELPLWRAALDHPTYDAFWREISVRERLSRVAVPAFSVAGWFDPNVESDLKTIAALRRASPASRIVVGPWAHNMSTPFPGVSFGPERGYPIRAAQYSWFDRWLKDKPEWPPGGPFTIFVMGRDQWREESNWPLKRAVPTRLYLAAKGELAAQPPGSGEERFTFDPRKPVPTRGGATCCNPQVFPWGPLDQRALGRRDDVLSYSTAPLAEEVEVTGPVRAVLYAATSEPDTDFTVKLIDVFPSGEARLLTDGILRLRYRYGVDCPVLAKPGTVYEIAVEAGVTSNVFLAGHRIRVDISSSNFPKYDRNPNTGRTIADERELRVARQTVYRGASRPSHILLPVIP
jgi:hypothetical protein